MLTALLSRRVILSSLALALVVATAGCGNRSYSKYVPSEDAARKALEQALGAWQNGQEAGLLDGSPPVQVVDSVWTSGQKLRSFEILKEEAGGGGPRVFSVRLNPVEGEPQVVRYFVVGRNPMLVYREDDYKAPQGM